MFFVLANSCRDLHTRKHFCNNLAQYTISTRGGSRGQQLVIIFQGKVLFPEYLEGAFIS